MKIAQGIRFCGAFIFQKWGKLFILVSHALSLHRWGWNLTLRSLPFGRLLEVKFQPHRFNTLPLRGQCRVPTRPAADWPTRWQRYRRRRQTPASQQNNTGPLGGPVINRKVQSPCKAIRCVLTIMHAQMSSVTCTIIMPLHSVISGVSRWYVCATVNLR